MAKKEIIIVLSYEYKVFPGIYFISHPACGYCEHPGYCCKQRIIKKHDLKLLLPTSIYNTLLQHFFVNQKDKTNSLSHPLRVYEAYFNQLLNKYLNFSSKRKTFQPCRLFSYLYNFSFFFEKVNPLLKRAQQNSHS